MKTLETKIIAKIKSDFPTKFGIPRQSGLTRLTSQIVFEPEFRFPEALRGLDEFTHIWIVWIFSECADKDWTPTVRPPKLGGNARKGVFATRSPFRPNPIGLSSVKLEKIEITPNGPVLTVSGADLMDGTPIIDIKPYVPYSDCHTDASGGFSVPGSEKLKVEYTKGALDFFAPEKRDGLLKILSEDPRPGYISDPDRIFGFPFCGAEVKFTVHDGVLTIRDIVPYDKL